MLSERGVRLRRSRARSGLFVSDLSFAFTVSCKAGSLEEIVAQAIDILEGIGINVALLEKGDDGALRSATDGAGDMAVSCA